MSHGKPKTHVRRKRAGPLLVRNVTGTKKQKGEDLIGDPKALVPIPVTMRVKRALRCLIRQVHRGCGK
jgi:hypothetical protein